MATTQLLLTGVPAFVANVTSSTVVQFTIDENDFDPAHLIQVDLANNTSLPPAQWANVEQARPPAVTAPTWAATVAGSTEPDAMAARASVTTQSYICGP